MRAGIPPKKRRSHGPWGGTPSQSPVCPVHAVRILVRCLAVPVPALARARDGPCDGRLQWPPVFAMPAPRPALLPLNEPPSAPAGPAVLPVVATASSPRWPGEFQPITAPWLDAVLALEQSAHTHPWTRGHFASALQAGNHSCMAVWRGQVLGYFMAMMAADEAHLLNIAVAPQWQGRGLARALLARLDGWARGQGALSLWLEVRQSSLRARRLYERHGYVQVGVRPRYYPARDGGREAAILMTRRLDGGPPDGAGAAPVPDLSQPPSA